MTKMILDNQTKKIVCTTTKDYIGVLLLNEEDLNKITANSGPLATHNEYQVHYWYVVLRKVCEDGSIVDIAIPTIFFNYKQEVGTASIDFTLDDVEELSEQLKTLQNEVLLDLTPKLTEFINKHDLNLLSVNLGTLHRHP